jgi:hypothetical protein
MVGNFCNRPACRIRNRRRRHDNNMTLRKKKTPRASQHYMGWRAGQKSLLLPVAGEFFLLTLPFIERGNRPSGTGRNLSDLPTNQASESQSVNTRSFPVTFLRDKPEQRPLAAELRVLLQSGFSSESFARKAVRAHHHLLDCSACRAACLCATGGGASPFNISHRMRL